MTSKIQLLNSKLIKLKRIKMQSHETEKVHFRQVFISLNILSITIALNYLN